MVESKMPYCGCRHPLKELINTQCSPASSKKGNPRISNQLIRSKSTHYKRKRALQVTKLIFSSTSSPPYNQLTFSHRWVMHLHVPRNLHLLRLTMARKSASTEDASVTMFKESSLHSSYRNI